MITIILFIFLTFFESNIIYSQDLHKKINEKNKNITQLQQISNAHSQYLIQIQKQLTENQHDIDILRGNIQDIQYNISNIITQQESMHHQINNFLKSKNLNLQYRNENNSDDVPNTQLQNQQTHQHTKKYTGIDAEQQSYKDAVNLVLKNKQYDQAIQLFHNFVKNYPKSIYQANAHYWLGQLYYQKGQKDNASHHFALVVKNYPKSSKAANALLKIGFLVQEKKVDMAKKIYQQVITLYPNSESAKQAKKLLYSLK
ncbi:tol-pal system protein YbgF [Candidatus Blochmannia ocreatus (nom. nud.)]|uniref:Cell division coordinator CpoB n=1 Tax=Candidatus Blochmannia ocreatus (nom. nud.) TaxID=251538 RepID=A0ABY4STV1_9ENTR|nr:tol-pal system protein YbgF [Candidatus Blochmannia ocreatus]URJ25400.1 tol-pal system protein YbgF [Candidatus Blochmannia ocreatus]